VLAAGFASRAAAESCPNEAFRNGPSANLSDCRAYEQVSPVDKNGGAFFEYLTGVGADGTPNLVMFSFTAIAGIQDNFGIPGGWYSTVLGPSGWVTSPTPPPASEYQTSIVAGGFAPLLGTGLDARSALWFERGNSQPENRVDLVVTRPGGAIEDIGPVTPPGTPPGEVNDLTNLQGLGVDPAGESDDMSHILFRTRPTFTSGYHFWPFDSTKEEGNLESLYEYVGSGNTVPMLVGVDSTGHLIGRCGTEVGGRHSSHNAMSADGNTVFFTALACGSSPRVDELFARIDNGQPDAHTVAISEPSAADCAACNTSEAAFEPAHFEGASLDGSKVFFTSAQPLLDGDASTNLYEYDSQAPAGEKLTRVSGGDSTVVRPAGELEGVVQTSEDGSHVYFVAQGVLTTTPNSRGQRARVGANNLYVFERDSQYPTGRTAFVADLSTADEGLWQRESIHPADVTPDGRFLVFTSATDHLTPDDTSTAAQVFEYDAQTGSLLRVSIGQNGYNDNGNTNLAAASISDAVYIEQDSKPTAYWSGLTMSADGSYVFFQSADGLTPQALNQRVVGVHNGEPIYANNIYEYHDGNVYLISDGQDVSSGFSDSKVSLLGTDASGADVLFRSIDRLAPQDSDTNADIYDARIGGGFATPVVPPECSSDGCQGPLSGSPVLLSPGSEFQAGGGNVAQPPSSSTTMKARPKAKRVKAKAKRRRMRGRKAIRGRARRATARRQANGKAGRS
jgi:hypothetical protein